MEFARHHAWEAFSQEDSFANGVGLGLSIVRHITSSLGGKIDLQSSVGKGTEIKILITLPLGSGKEEETQNVVKAVARRVHGLRLCMLDPGYASSHHVEVELNRRADDTLRRMASSWFGMEVFKSPTIQDVRADFFIYLEPPSVEHLLQHHGLGTENTHVPLIVITPNAFESAALRKDIQKLKEMGRTIDIISQPCGPQKLASALERCIYREPFIAPTDIGNASLTEARINGDMRDTGRTAQYEDIPDTFSASASEPAVKGSDVADAESINSNAGLCTPTDATSESVGVSTLQTLNTHHRALSSTSDEKSIATNEDLDKDPVLLVDDNQVNLKLLVACESFRHATLFLLHHIW